MATGDALQVGIAIPFPNWRGDHDYDLSGIPNGWGKAGSGSATWRKKGTGTAFGLSTVGAVGIVSTGPANYVYLRSHLNSVPWIETGASVTNSKYYVWTAPYVDSDFLRTEIHLMSIGGASVANQYFTDTHPHAVGAWQLVGGTGPTFTSASAYVELRFMNANATTLSMAIDSPCVIWNANGATGGPRSMATRPATNGTALSCTTLANLERGYGGRSYLTDPYGASVKWRLTLAFEDMDAADFYYWSQCYAVNRGASGFMTINGGRLGPMPVAVIHHFAEPLYSGASTFLDVGKPPVIIGNIVDFNVTAREYLGWGYSGTITIEEM